MQGGTTVLSEEREARLADFVTWTGANIKGDEKGEAQVFLDRLFRGFGHQGVKEAGGVLEERIKKAGGKGTSFADLVWKPVVLVEMKKRGEDLTRHYRQAFDYWTRLVPGRPRYVILCNFDEFWIYDFDAQMDAPVDRVHLADLPKRWGPMAFLFPKPEKPVFGNDQVAVTRKAADQLAACFNKLTGKHRLGGQVEDATAQRFVLQMLVALFAEDIGLLPRYTVEQLLAECRTKQDSRDLIGGLFEAMNTPEKTPDDRYQEVAYFNGGLFAHPARVELKSDEVELLKLAAREDWSKVRPEIFGTLFEHSTGKAERHAFGAHFTHPTDIMKIVGPTIVEPWRNQIEAADTLKRLRDLWQRMQDYTVLDPACGSGNFLYTAYRELKRLEARLFERMAELSGSYDASQRVFGFVSARQFYGLDINPFAVELAKVTMMIARKLAIDELHITERALPLDNLDANFKAVDALIDEQGNPSQWPPADVIIGNPPFLGAKRLKPERGPDYVNAVRRAYPEVPGMADYCVYWFRKAHDHLSPCTPADPFTGRAGLVGTQNIRNNQSRVGGLDYIVTDGTIIEAVDNQPWSGEANVHVSIANWVKTQDPALLPSVRRLWTRVDNVPGKVRDPSLRTGPAAKDYELDCNEFPEISPSLSDSDGHLVPDSPTVQHASAKGLQRAIPEACRVPPHAGGSGHDEGARTFQRRRGSSLLNRADHDYSGQARPIHHRLPEAHRPRCSRVQGAFQKVTESVLPHIRSLAEKEREKTDKATGQDQNWLQTWWQHFRSRQEMHDAVGLKDRYIACCEVTKRPIFCFVHSEIRPDKTMEVFAFDDDYSFGILQSNTHWQWFVAKCSKLKSDFRYTPESVFDTFPWPQTPTVAQIDAVAEAGREVRRVRNEALTKIKGGLRAVYRNLELPGKNPLKDTHAALDAAVMTAYGFSPRKDLLAQLLALNLEVARHEQAGQPVTAPGVPPGYPDPARLVTDDCIRAS